MTNAPSRGSTSTGTSRRCRHVAEVAAGPWRPRAQMGRDNARTPMQWDAPRTPVHHGHPVDRVNQNYPRERRRRGADPDSVFHHYRRADRPAPRRPGGRPRRLHPAAARRRAGVRLHAPARRRGALVLGNFSGSVQDAVLADDPGGADPVQLRGPGHDAASVGGAGVPTRGSATVLTRGPAPQTPDRRPLPSVVGHDDQVATHTAPGLATRRSRVGWTCRPPVRDRDVASAPCCPS